MGKMLNADLHRELDHVRDTIHEMAASASAHASGAVHTVMEALHKGPLSAILARIPEAERKLHVIDEKLKADFLHFHDEVRKVPAAGEGHAPEEHVERLQAYKTYVAARVPPAK